MVAKEVLANRYLRLVGEIEKFIINSGVRTLCEHQECRHYCCDKCKLLGPKGCTLKVRNSLCASHICWRITATLCGTPSDTLSLGIEHLNQQGFDEKKLNLIKASPKLILKAALFSNNMLWDKYLYEPRQDTYNQIMKGKYVHIPPYAIRRARQLNQMLDQELKEVSHGAT